MSSPSTLPITNTAQIVPSEVASSNKATTKAARLAKRVAEAQIELTELAQSCILPTGSKRLRKQALHPDQAYLDSVVAHDRACLPTGGLMTGSGLHYDSKFRG